MEARARRVDSRSREGSILRRERQIGLIELAVLEETIRLEASPDGITGVSSTFAERGMRLLDARARRP
jgi:hypothetical protein